MVIGHQIHCMKHSRNIFWCGFSIRSLILLKIWISRHCFYDNKLHCDTNLLLIRFEKTGSFLMQVGSPLLTHNFDFTVAPSSSLSLFPAIEIKHLIWSPFMLSSPFALPLRYSIVAAAAAAAREVTLIGWGKRGRIYNDIIDDLLVVVISILAPRPIPSMEWNRSPSERLKHPMKRVAKSSHTRALVSAKKREAEIQSVLKVSV